MTLKIIDLFSGIGGFALAADWVGGFETIQFVEQEPFCQKILAQHWPDVPIHDDVCTYNPTIGIADVVCGGFPCQDISLAGKQAGIEVGTRSGLFYELLRVVCAVRPRFVVLENVAAITSNGLGTVLGELAKAGYDAEWACIPASAVGACHQRNRWWCVAYATRMFSHVSANQQQGKPGWTTFPESGDGDRADASNADSARSPQERNQLSTERAEQYRGLDAIANTSGERLERKKYPQWRIAKQISPNWREYVSEPVIRRGDDGLSNRAHRLKALGNAVVPQVAMIPLARVLALANLESIQ